jgi:hypothetical protein
MWIRWIQIRIRNTAFYGAGLVLNTLGGVVYTYVKYKEKGRQLSREEGASRKFSLSHEETARKGDHVV